MANSAYMRFLRDALEQCGLQGDALLGARSFLGFLDGYRPQDDAVSEPDLYEYGDAAGTYAFGYCDEQTLGKYDIDVGRLGDTGELLTHWTDLMHDAIGESDLLPDTLDFALQDLGLREARKTVEPSPEVETTDSPSETRPR